MFVVGIERENERESHCQLLKVLTLWKYVCKGFSKKMFSPVLLRSNCKCFAEPVHQQKDFNGAEDACKTGEIK